MTPRLQVKLDRIRTNPAGRDFILADAKDADMGFGISYPGSPHPADGRAYRTRGEFHEQIRQIVRQGVVDLMLASASTMSVLAFGERLFETSDVTPAARVNDTTDIWCVR